MDLKEFGIYFSKIREKSGYRSQRELADKSGVSHSTINRIESGITKANAPTLKKLAPYLKDVTYNDLMQAAGYIEGDTSKKEKPNAETNDSPISIAFSDGGESLTEDEKKHLEDELIRYRELKARFMREKNRD